MKNQAKPVSKPKTTVPRKSAAKKTAESRPISLVTDEFLTKHMNIFLWLVMGLSTLFSLMLFDPNVSVGGDDSTYIIRAANFLKNFDYPSYQGPLYPLMLAIFVAFAGLNLTVLKSFSLVCMVGFIYFTHRAFVNRIPPMVHVTVLLVVSVNSFILNYASQTFSEAFFMLMQSLLVLVVFKYFLDQEKEVDLKKDIRRHLILALVILSLILIRSIGITTLLATTGYFLLRGQWKNLILGLISFASLFLIYQSLKYIFWGDASVTFSSQGSTLLRKDFYNPSMGNEDFAGFITRFYENSNLYLSRHFYNMAGFRKYEAVQSIVPWLMYLFYAFFVTGFILAWLKNRYLFFIGLLSGIFILTTFFILQTNWDQSRLIIPAFPFLITVCLASFTLLSGWKKLKPVYWLLPVMGIFMFSQLFSVAVKESKIARQKTGKFDGFSPDWKHYVQASEWAAKNLPKEDVIACRKPSISFIYGNGREFYGISNVPSFNTDLFFRQWKNEKIPYNVFLRKELARTPMEPSVVYQIKNGFIAQIVTDTNAFLFYRFPDSLQSSILSKMRRSNLKPMTDPDSVQKIVTSGKKPPILIYPDSLLLPLMKNGVTYVIQANLRQFAHQKDGNIINTVERYMSLITDKYDDFMAPVQKIGADDDEPATIFKLNYEKQKKLMNIRYDSLKTKP